MSSLLIDRSLSHLRRKCSCDRGAEHARLTNCRVKTQERRASGAQRQFTTAPANRKSNFGIIEVNVRQDGRSPSRRKMTNPSLP
eukprot:2017574-Pleurochrysis_carterae.AAC.1